MTCTTITAGSALLYSFEFDAADDDEPCTPVTVTATLLRPDGTTLPLSPTQQSAEVWEGSTPVLTVPGIYFLHGRGQGAGCDVVAEQMFQVVATRVPV